MGVKSMNGDRLTIGWGNAADVYLRGSRQFGRKKPAVDNSSWWWPSGCQIERWRWYGSVPTCAVQTSTWEPPYFHQSEFLIPETFPNNLISYVIRSHRWVTFQIPICCYHYAIMNSKRYHIFIWWLSELIFASCILRLIVILELKAAPIRQWLSHSISTDAPIKKWQRSTQLLNLRYSELLTSWRCWLTKFCHSCTWQFDVEREIRICSTALKLF